MHRLQFLILLPILVLFFPVLGQDVITVDNNQSGIFGTSIADQFTIYEVLDNSMDAETFLQQLNKLEGRKIDRRLENLDFTTSSFFIFFTIDNKTDRPLKLMLETARPITNEVLLYSVSEKTTVVSGDAMAFGHKTVPTNKSVLPLIIKSNDKQTYVLKLTSDGEALTLPMIFYDDNGFKQWESSRQLFSGIFFGIFIFVIIIYLTFYVLLREKLFLLYVVYVFFAGLLQMALDGYVHQYFLPSGGFWTQHSVIVIAGLAVLFALIYASGYLRLSGKLKWISNGLIAAIAVTMVISVIPGMLYKLAYPLINALSFVAMLYLLVAALILRKKNRLHRFFTLGLSMLVIGGLIFILGNVGWIDAPALTQQGLKIGTLMEIICLSILMAGRYKTLQEEKEKAQIQLLIELEEANVRLEVEVAERTKEIEKQRLLLKKRNEDFVASVKYAERIQSAVLSNEDKFKSILPESFVVFRPKDIVSGDFYWVDTIEPSENWPNGLIVYATADCTGHGVPGAFVSIIGNHLLKLGKTNQSVQSPGEVLDFLNREINESLNSKYGREQIRDGMDITLCAIDLVKKELHFSGAKNSAYIVRNGEIIQLKGDRKAIGFDDSEDSHRFETKTASLKSGDVIYTFSDGFADQFGGPAQKKFMIKRLKQLFSELRDNPMDIQQQKLEKAFDDWKGDQEQVDDVLLIGVRID